MAILDTLGREETTTAEVSLQMWMYNVVYSNQAKELSNWFSHAGGSALGMPMLNGYCKPLFWLKYFNSYDPRWFVALIITFCKSCKDNKQ